MKIFRGVFETLSEICDGAFCENHALCDLVSFVQFKIMKNTHGGVLLLVLKVALLRGCFSRFLNCTNDTKSLKTSHNDFWIKFVIFAQSSITDF